LSRDMSEVLSSAWCASYAPSPRLNTGIVIWDGCAGPSSVPPRVKKEPRGNGESLMKKEPHVKEESRVKDEQMDEAAPEEDERPRWVKERDLLNFASHLDDLEDTPSLHLLWRGPTLRPSRCPRAGPPHGRRRTATTSSTSPRTTTT
jgi:hypothetical protein